MIEYRSLTTHWTQNIGTWENTRSHITPWTLNIGTWENTRSHITPWTQRIDKWAWRKNSRPWKLKYRNKREYQISCNILQTKNRDIEIIRSHITHLPQSIETWALSKLKNKSLISPWKYKFYCCSSSESVRNIFKMSDLDNNIDAARNGRLGSLKMSVKYLKCFILRIVDIFSDLEDKMRQRQEDLEEVTALDEE